MVVYYFEYIEYDESQVINSKIVLKLKACSKCPKLYNSLSDCTFQTKTVLAGEISELNKLLEWISNPVIEGFRLKNSGNYLIEIDQIKDIELLVREKFNSVEWNQVFEILDLYKVNYEKKYYVWVEGTIKI